MKRFRGTLVILSMTLVVACALPRDEAALLEVVDYGIYKPERGTPVLTELTDQIPTIVGTRFGMRLRVSRLYNRAYLCEIIFELDPPRTQPPKRSVCTLRIYGWYVEPVTWTIDEDSAGIAGTLTFRLIFPETRQVVLERSFDLYVPPPENPSVR